jgi:hypothetical protein
MTVALVGKIVFDPRAKEAASSAQTWAIRCATGKDVRALNLTRGQATEMLNEANEKSGYVKQPKMKSSPAIEPAQG